MNKLYKEQVRLLLRILPIIYREENFAVHGGTAINLFIKNLPRYSVDVDVTYIPLGPRDESLAEINKKLGAISLQLQRAVPDINIRPVPNKLRNGKNRLTQILVFFLPCSGSCLM